MRIDDRPFLIFKDSSDWDVAFTYLAALSPARSLISPTPNPYPSLRKRPSETRPPRNGAFRESRGNEGTSRSLPSAALQVSEREQTDQEIPPSPHQSLTSFQTRDLQPRVSRLPQPR